MTKQELLQAIIRSLESDLELFTAAARTAHEAATHAECLPDNKYDTTALEASYLAQGQANRAQDIRMALEAYRGLILQAFDDQTPVRLTALVCLEDADGTQRSVFLGPWAGGMKVVAGDRDVVVITPGSPLGRRLLGRCVGDELQLDEQAIASSLLVVAVE